MTNARDSRHEVRADAPSREAEKTPGFARNYPDDSDLAKLVQAFGRGDFKAVRLHAPGLAASSSDLRVKLAAAELLARINPSRAEKTLLHVTFFLLVFITGWWLLHRH